MVKKYKRENWIDDEWEEENSHDWNRRDVALALYNALGYSIADGNGDGIVDCDMAGMSLFVTMDNDEQFKISVDY